MELLTVSCKMNLKGAKEDKQLNYLVLVSNLASPVIHFTYFLMYFYTFKLHVHARKAHAGGGIFAGLCREDWFYCCCTLRPLTYPSLIALLRMDIINVNYKGALFSPFFKWSVPQKRLQNYCCLSLLPAQERGFSLFTKRLLFC